jgi:predicted nucleotidyltransferase
MTFASGARRSSESRRGPAPHHPALWLGSERRRSAREHLDFLVDFDPDRTAIDLSAVVLDLEAALGREVDVKELAGDGRDSERIRREAIAR